MSKDVMSPDACMKIFYDWMFPVVDGADHLSVPTVADDQHALLLALSETELSQLHGATHKVAQMATGFLPVLCSYFARKGWDVPNWEQIDPPSSLRDPPPIEWGSLMYVSGKNYTPAPWQNVVWQLIHTVVLVGFLYAAYTIGRNHAYEALSLQILSQSQQLIQVDEEVIRLNAAIKNGAGQICK